MMARDGIERYDEPPLSRFPRRRHHTAHRERASLVEQRPLARSRLERRLDKHVHLPFTSDAQVPRRDLVRARAIVAELGPSGADDVQRHLAHVLLEAAAAHVPGGGAVLGDEQLRALVPVRRAADADHRRERGALTDPTQLRQTVEHCSGFEPLLHRSRTLSRRGPPAQRTRGSEAYFSRATVGVANPGRGRGGRPRCSRARFRASSMLPWTFSSPNSSYVPERSSATTGWACTSDRMTSVPSLRLRCTTSRSACSPVESITGTCRSRRISTFGFPAIRPTRSLNISAAPKKNGPVISYTWTPSGTTRRPTALGSVSKSSVGSSNSCVRTLM